MKGSNICDDGQKKVLLLHFAGVKIQQLFDSLPEIEFPNGKGPLLNIIEYVPHMTDYEMALIKLNKFFQREKNYTFERHILRQMSQLSDEKIDRFVIRLQKQAKRCNFNDQEKENVKDQVISGCRSINLRRELLKKGCANLEEILRVANIFETVADQEKAFVIEQKTVCVSEEVNKIDVKTKSWNHRQSFESREIECNRCGFRGHKASAENCPAKGKLCNKCGGKDHFYRKCRSLKRVRNFNEKADCKDNVDSRNNSNVKRQKTENIDLITNVDNEYVFCITDCEVKNEIICKIGGIKIKIVVDSGSKFNLIDEKSWSDLKSKKVAVVNQRKGSDKIFKAYGGHLLIVIGVFEALIEVGNNNVSSDFYVIKGDGKCLLGRDTASLLGILKIDCDIQNIEEKLIEGEFNKIKDIAVEIPIKTDVKPVIQSYRRVPVALEEIVDKKIDELLKQGIIESVNGPSKWVSPLVIIPKRNDIRICVDMRRANEAVERENHPLPIMDDFLPHIRTGKFFSKLDIKNAFHQV